jgi:CHAD domain-containing protein
VRERELKLAVGDTFVMPSLVGDGSGVVAVRDLPELELGSVYHDTADLRLARNGVTLRYRIGDEGGPRWSLKLPVPDQDLSEREELSFDGGPAEIPHDARDLVAAWARRGHLAPAAALSTRRRRWLLEGADGADLAELVHDDVSVLDGDRVVGRFRELELESRGPELDALQPVVLLLQRAGATPAEPMPKAVRALGPRAAAPPDVVLPTADPKGEAAGAVRLAMASGVRRLIAYDAPTRLGEAEPLHQMRVATRRLRADLRTFAPLLDPDWTDGLVEELRWLGDLLGAVRDRDVQLVALADGLGDLQTALVPLVTAIEDARKSASAELMAGLATPRYLDMLERLVQAAREPMLTEEAGRRADKSVDDLLAKVARRTRRRAKAVVADSPDEVFHAARIAAKKLRYAAEAIGPFTSRHTRRVGEIARRSSRLQDLLGKLQDVLVMQQQVRITVDARPKDATFAFAAGRYLERLEEDRHHVRAAFPPLRKALLRELDRWAEDR